LSFKNKNSTKGRQKNTQTLGSSVRGVENDAVLFQMPGERPREGGTKHRDVFQCCVAPASLISSDRGLARCDQVQWPPYRMENQQCSRETSMESIHRAPGGSLLGRAKESLYL